jgi:hypothetical protein
LSYQPFVTVNIALDVTAVNRASFGTPIFIADHVWFKEQTRSYTSFKAIAEDVPTGSNVYAAMQSAYSKDIDPTIVKVGRREVDSITFTPTAATTAGQVYTLAVLDTADATTTATFTTSTGSETATDIATAIFTALGSPAGVTVVDNTGSVTLSKSGTAAYAVTDVARFTYTTVTSQSAADMMATITDADNDFYFVACSDHSQAFVLALSQDVEARVKQYWVSTQDQVDLGVYSESATDTPSILKQEARFRTFHWFHDEADSIFPEMLYISMLATAVEGKGLVAINTVSAGGAAKNPLTGNFLNTTDKTNLQNKNSSFTEVVGGVAITRRGTAAGSATHFADIIRDRDFLTARVSENYQNFMIREGKIAYTDSGIARLKNVLSSTLDRYIETETQANILQKDNPYVITFPSRADSSFADVASRIYNGGFTAYLAGGIQIVVILGSLTYEAES